MVNYSDKTLDKREQQIKERENPIKFTDNVEIKKVEDIFDRLFNKSFATFKLNGHLHCRSNRGRSYIDAYNLCRYYFPELSYKEMYRKLYKLVEEQNPEHKQGYRYGNKPQFFTCYIIGRSRFYGHLKL